MPYERAVSNRIIEEFMLVCNETIAESIGCSLLNMPFCIQSPRRTR